MSYGTKNHTEQGGERTVIGGELEILAGAKLIIDEGAVVEGLDFTETENSTDSQQNSQTEKIGGSSETDNSADEENGGSQDSSESTNEGIQEYTLPEASEESIGGVKAIAGMSTLSSDSTLSDVIQAHNGLLESLAQTGIILSVTDG